jgi:hypothetical protein
MAIQTTIVAKTPITAPTNPFLKWRTGTWEQMRATQTISPANGFCVSTRRYEISGKTGLKSAAIKPMTVMGTTTGSTKKLLGIDIRLN